MSYKEELYQRALKTIETIYQDSKYDSKVDLYRSFDIINSVNENQILNKEWLVKELLPYIDQSPHARGICVLGGWYGLIALMLKQKISNIIENVDSDPLCAKYGKLLIGYPEGIHFITSTAEEWIFDRPRAYQVIINTSVEHMEQEDINLMIGLKRKESIVCLQGNNYHNVQSHINTHNSLDEFVDSFNLKEILFRGSLPSACGKYDRYMVIGK